MFKKILIANRGEIALRIIRTCKEMGIETVAVYSEADADSLHVRFADEDVCIGPPQAAESYRNVSAILSAAAISGADAIHPGYGFLAENERFAELVAEAGLRFIGPSPKAIERMGNKVAAIALAREVGVPVTPGSDGGVASADAAAKVAGSIGYPVILKAAAGGGGRGMRVARSEEDILRLFPTASEEAAKAFGSGEIYVERYVEGARHVEIQIAGDAFGDVIHLGERDCSIQRRHQKIVEEAPSPAVTPDLRRRMGEAAVAVARAAGYVTVGTVEFLLAPDGAFYFMEMNTRIQVEHPVTEMVTGIDLVREQIRLAAGEALSLRQEDLEIRGHAIEFRINAEDPDANFRPAPGRIEALHVAGGYGVRVDKHIYVGYVVPPHYDSLLAKLIVWGRDRTEAIARARRALDEFILEGIPTTISLHRRIVEDPDFVRGEAATDFLERFFARAG